MAPEPISTAYFINPSHQSVCLNVHPLIDARQQRGKNITAATSTQSSRRMVGRVNFYAVHVVKKRGDYLWPELFLTPDISVPHDNITLFPGLLELGHFALYKFSPSMQQLFYFISLNQALRVSTTVGHSQMLQVFCIQLSNSNVHIYKLYTCSSEEITLQIWFTKIMCN
jgi:hypothetical protein